MKRITGFFVALLIMIMPCISYADTDTLLDALTADITSAEIHTDFSVTLNKPMEFLNVLSENNEGMFELVDIKKLAESTCDIKESCDTKFYISEDKKVMQLSAETELNLPLVFNDSLKTDIWAKIGFWIDIDITDINKPVYKVIYKVPFSTDYISVDINEMTTGEIAYDTLSECIEKFSDKIIGEEYYDTYKKIILDNMDIKEIYKGKRYELTVDDKGFKNLIKEFFAYSVEIFGDTFDFDNINEDLDKIADIPILGSNGLKITVELNRGQISKIDTEVNIKCNLYDLFFKDFLDDEAYNREDFWLDLTLNRVSVYTSINNLDKVEIPTVNNSFNDWFYSDYYTEIITSGEVKPDEEGMFSLPLCEVARGMHISLDEYSIDGNNIKITPENLDFTEALMTIGSDSVYIDGTEHKICKAPYADEKGLIYLPIDAIELLTKSKINEIRYTLSGSKIRNSLISLEKNNDYDDYDYTPQYISAYNDGKPIVKEGALYIPFRGMLDSFYIYDESIVYNNGVITVKSDKDELFTELVITENSADIYVNGVKHTLKLPVTEVNGAAYIPEDMLPIINCKLESVTYSYDGDYTRVYIIRTSDDETEEEYYDDSYYEYMSYSRDLYLYVYSEGDIVEADGEYYIALYPLMGELQVSGDNIFELGSSVSIVSENPLTGFNIMLISDNDVTKDDVKYTLKNPMINLDGVYYVPSEFVDLVLGGKIKSVSRCMYDEKPSTVYNITVPNPLYKINK